MIWGMGHVLFIQRHQQVEIFWLADKCLRDGLSLNLVSHILVPQNEWS